MFSICQVGLSNISLQFLRITNWTIKVINLLRLSDAIDLLTKIFFPNQKVQFPFKAIPLIQEWYQEAANLKNKAPPTGAALPVSPREPTAETANTSTPVRVGFPSLLPMAVFC